MENQTIYFCQGCSAVLYHRVKYCPHCGEKQYYEYTCDNCNTEVTEFDDYCPECGDYVYSDEFKPRSCKNCGYDLDIDGRNLDRRYCNGSDCGKEIGGLIRYSEETGKELSLKKILDKNDYRKELKDWLKSIYNSIYDTGFSCFNRLLYVYDKKGTFMAKDFIEYFRSMFEDQFMYELKIFDHLSYDENIDVLLDKEKHLPKKEQHCFCVMNTFPNSEKTDANTIIEEYVGDYTPGMVSEYFDTIKKLNVTFVFVSSNLPEVSKIYDMYDKHILIVTPEKLNSINISKLWKQIKEEFNGT